MNSFFRALILSTLLVSCAIETGVEDDIFLFLVVNEVGDHQVELSWTVSGNDGPVMYRVAVDDSTVVDNYPETRYTITQLNSSSDYTIEVFATDSGGNMASDGFEITTLEDTVWEGPYELDSQEKYDNFDLTRVVGELRIRNLQTDDLAKLASLEAIGSLLIENCQITSLNGLQNIEEFILGIGGVTLTGNPNLEDVSALSNLSGTMGQLLMTNNPSLTDFEGLGLAENAILQVSGSPVANLGTLEVSNPLRRVSLADLPNFNDLGPLASKTVTEALEFENLPELTSFSGMGNITELSKRLVLRNLPNIDNLQGLQNIQSVGLDPNTDPLTRSLAIQNLGITSLAGLNSLSAANRIVITDCAGLLNLSGTSLQESVPEGLSLIIQRNEMLTNFCGFTELANNVDFSQYEVTGNAYNPTLAQLRSPTQCSQ